MVEIDFNAENYEPSTGFEPLPAGYHICHITNSDKRDAKSGSGWYLWFEFEVREGKYAGRKVFWNCNMGNNNAEAVRIANAQFSALCRAVGKMRPRDTSELHMLPVEIKVTVRKETEQFPASNEIRGFRAPGSGGPVAGAGSSSAAPPAGPAQPDWRRQ